MLYFAYCTLLDEAEMRRFVPDALPRDTGTCVGWRVGFAAYADGRGGCQLLPEPGHQVHGLLWELTADELTHLDTISGVPDGFYQRVDVDVLTTSGVIRAVTYAIPSPL